jgi:integrase
MKDIMAEDVEAYRKFAAVQTLRKWIGGPKKETYSPSRGLWKDTGRPRSKREVNNYLKCLRALLAIGERTRDPMTRLPVVDVAPEIRLYKMPRRMPRPITDDELHDRLDNAKPWTREAAELARLFGLRLTEALALQLRHIDRETQGLRFEAGDTKSGNDEWAFGGAAGWQLLLDLERKARQRGQVFLVTWPGPKKWRAWLQGQEVSNSDWRPLKGITRSWKTSARAAGIEQPRRFHDVRARYITEVAKVQPAAAQDAARHQDSSTTALYIKLAAGEIRQAVALAVAKRPARQNVKLKSIS